MDERKPKQKPPPKIRGKHFTNLEYLADASLVWLTPCQSKSFPSDQYNETIDTSYFEQCFSIVDKQGEGSFGSVLRVICKEDNKFYAMKVSKEPFRNDCDRTLKVHEVEHHNLVSSHPNIVTLYDAWEEDRHMYMQMELCKESLDKTKVVSENKCWEVLIDMVLALDFIHDFGMGHFDVKLENILQGYDGLYKLSDFGLMYHFEKDGEKVPNEGDAKYMAPELLSSKKDFTTKADIFSLGISILELAGNLILPTNGEVWKALRENTFPLTQTKHLSDELFYLLTKMMSSESSQRPSAKEILNMPVIKAIIAQRKDSEKRSAFSTIQSKMELLPYLALWAFFLALVHFMAKEMVKQTSREMNEMEVEVSATQRNDSAVFLGNSFASGCSDIPPKIFATSTPCLRNEDKTTAVANCSTAGLVNGNCASYIPVQNYTPISCSEDRVNQCGLANQANSQIQNRNEQPSPCRTRSLIYPGTFQEEITFSFPSPSSMPFGISPIRLSHELKEVVKAKKRRRLMVPRNLSKSFEDYDK